MDLNRLQLFTEIVRCGNLTQASKVLGLQKSKLSRDLALLEEEVGTALVYRTTRQFRLTEMGQRLFEGASESLAHLDALFERTKTRSKEMEGSVRLTCPEDMGHELLVPLIAEFRKTNPGLSIELLMSSTVIDLVAEQVDLAVRMGELKDSTLKTKKVGRVSFGLYCSKSFYESRKWSDDIDELSRLATVSMISSQMKNQWVLINGRQKKTIKIKPVLAANSYVAVRSFILQGEGVGLLPHFMTETEAQKGGLVPVFKPWTVAPATIQIVYPHQKEVPFRVQALMDHLIKALKVYF